VLILIYTRFNRILHNLGETETGEMEAVRRHALAITEAVLYIKQHSVNCISAAMYAMTRYDDSFPPEEAKAFVRDLFHESDDILKEDAGEIRGHILNLYRQFLENGQKTDLWEKPLLDFLGKLPKI